MGLNLTTRIDKASFKIIDFDGVTYGLTTTPVTIFNITGRVWIVALAVYCKTSLVGSGATVELGTANSATSLIGSTAISGITANKWWNGTSPATDVMAPLGPLALANGPIQVTIGTANVTAGELHFYCWWHPFSGGGMLA